MRQSDASRRKTAVAVISPRFGPVGGAESYASHLTEQLSRQEDFEIHVFANRWSTENHYVTFHKVPLIPYPRFLRPLSFARSVGNQIAARPFDLIHSHDRVSRMDILSMHGIPHVTWMKKVRQKRLSLFDRTTAWLEGKALKGPRFPMILPVSGLVKEELQHFYEIPESKLKVIHPGVSPERFLALDQEKCRHEIRSRYGFLSSDIVVLFVGLNFKVKRLDLVLRGVAQLVNRGRYGTTTRLLVVGKGNRRRYRAMAADLGIADRVVFCGITHEIEKYYLASDLFVMPSSYDTFGLVVLEAMMAGLPVIITQKVGARDLVHSGVHGFILGDDPSPFELEEKMALLMERENRLRMGENARKTAQMNTWDKKGATVAEIYRSLASEKRS